MSVTPVEGGTPTANTPQSEFDGALDESLKETMINQAILVGGQFIIMPQAQEILKEAMSEDEE